MVEIGDRVQIDEAVSNYYGRCGIVVHDDICSTYPYRVKFDDGDDCIFKGKDLIVLSTEKFKVGDKVKVKDSWFGFTGEVGLIVRIDGSAKYPYRVKFDVVDEEDEEIFAEGSLELVKEKQSFTKSDLKTGMEVYFTEYQYQLLTDQVFDQDCVFKREPEPEPKPEPEPIKMTMKEINEHFGKAIEIIE